MNHDYSGSPIRKGGEDVTLEASQLVTAREDHYTSLGSGLVRDPDQDPTHRLWWLRPASAAATLTIVPLAAVLGPWLILVAAFVGFTGIAIDHVSESRHLKRIAPSLRADVVAARDDFRAALAALTTSDTETSVAMAVKWLEPRMDEALAVLASDFPYVADVERATETILSIGARAWALAQVEERRVHVIEAAVAPAVEELSEAVEVSPIDFTEIDAVTAGVVAETNALAVAMDVEVPALVETLPVPDDSIILSGYLRYAHDSVPPA